MKYLFILIFILPIVSFGQKTLASGQGILKIELVKLPTILFYNDTLQTKPSKSISVIKPREFALKNEKEISTWFKPEQLFLEYDIFILRVDTIIGKWAKVCVNNEKAVKLWTKIDQYKMYFTWDKFFKTKVTNITKETNELAVKQSDNDISKTIKKMEKEDCFEILDGWVKWRENNQLTIEFGLID
jgi:hypothetical protein